MPNKRLLTALAAGLTLALAACGAGAKSQKPAAIAETPTPSATPTPTPTPQAVYPLTGLPATNAAHAKRPALSVKIDNIDAALPQSGLNQADIVTDILVEGGLTRLLATFQSQDASLIGPIRSARPVDADLTRELNGGIFAYSGAAAGEIAPSINHSTALLISNDHNPQWFWRASNRAAPHNVFSSTTRLYAAGTASHRKFRPPPQLFAYSPTAPAGRVVKSVRLPFSSYSTAAWTWTGSDYVRTQNGRADRLANGARVNAKDIVILSVTWRPTNIVDAAGNRDPYVIVIGSGPAWVMRNGTVIAGRWTRPSYRVPFRLTDKSGQVIALDPGRAWIELQPRPFTPAFS